MADAPGNAITAAFPAPPPFYNSFTRENLTRLQDLREAAVAAGSQELVAKDVPEELQHLIPPEPPTAPYRSFGELHEVHSSDCVVTVSMADVDLPYSPSHSCLLPARPSLSPPTP